MKLLVLGGTRFVGRAVVDALLDSHDVTVLNRGTQPLWDGRITQLVADRDDTRQMADAWTVAYDAVVDVSATVPGHLRHLPRATEIPRYVFISSAAVYSRESAAPPFREDDRADGDAIWGGYGEAKATCERLLREALPARSLTVLRPPYVYGPHNTEQREQFLWARMAADQPVFVPGDGRTRIQFCASRTVAETVVAAVEGRLPAGTYNVAEQRGYTFLEYLAVLADVIGLPAARIVPVTDPSVPAREYFPFRQAELTLDVSRLAALGLVPDVDLASGLVATLAWFRRNGGLPDEPTPREYAWRATTPGASPWSGQGGR
ncbi:NAD-dependent epimerase/dehydratase family protein [Micromonospora sp. NPDC049204]|uniref:NAD-dependent epimerase/dehydratase family protein n=1 Tax=Micromonospora sp. NPDC049204 TaxID=3154351 RepID=UPI0033DCD8D6